MFQQFEDKLHEKLNINLFYTNLLNISKLKIVMKLLTCLTGNYINQDIFLHIIT